MTCGRVRALLSDYLDGELSPSLMSRVQGHLTGCMMCEREHQSLRRTVHLTALYGRQPAPIDCREQVLARIRQAPVATGRPWREGVADRIGDWARMLVPPVGLSPGRALAAGALALVCLGGASFLMRSEAPEERQATPVAANSTPREDYLDLHRPYQFGQAMGRDDGIILASDIVGAP
jgi:anti-sigma factor RsiW